MQKLLQNPRFLVAIALITGLLVCLFGPLNFVIDQNFWVRQLENLGNWAICWFICAYIILTILGIPGTILTVAGGLVFGLIWGTVWSVIGATLGALGAFWTARYLLQDWAKRKFDRHSTLKRFTQAVNQSPLAFIFIVRFAPISPFNVVNFLFGLTPIRWEHYALGTFFGIIPGTLAYTWLGVSGKEALQGGDRIPVFLALGFLTLLSIIPLMAKNRKTVS